MKKIILLLTAVASLGIANSAHADIGDTPASSEAKYGKGTLDLPRISYFHNGWWIRETFNANEICAMVEFARLDGKQVARAQADSMDKNNLPSSTLGSFNSNGWVVTKWKKTDNLDVWSYEWSTSQTQCQVLAGHFRYGNDTHWYYGRTYITPEGNEIVKQENAKDDAAKNGNDQTPTTGNPDTNI
jgi:hypothetical protein